MTVYTRPPRARLRAIILTLVAFILVCVVLATTGGATYRTRAYLADSLDLSTTLQTVLDEDHNPGEAAANTTLGFAKLLALSAKPSWRTRGLAAAADLVGLDISTPSQPPITNELIAAFQGIAKDKGKKGPAPGSAKAWLAHVDLLRHVVSAGWDTAFIVEDDVDFDVAIKQQMQLISDNVRNYTNTPEDEPAPYGTSWDVLWVGHCGSWIFKEMLPDMHIFPDETRVLTDEYAGWSKRFVREFLAEGYRAVHHSSVSVCTFGYGVSRAGARKIIELSLRENGAEAFDVALSEYCRDRKLDCLIVSPEVFHQYEPPKALGYVSEVRAGDGKGTPEDESRFEHTMGGTENIAHSARCQALFGTTCVAQAWQL